MYAKQTLVAASATVRDAAAPPRLTREISDRIAVGRLVLVLGIVWLHAPPYQSLAALGLSPLELLKGFVSGTLFRASLPVMTAMSAYLLFTAEYPYLKLVRKKFQTLIVPMLIWGAPVALGIYHAQRLGLAPQQFSETLWPADLHNWLNALFAIDAHPANYPLYFLRDLFVLALVSPLVRLFALHAPLVGLLVAIAVVIGKLDGALLFRNDLLLYFYLGAVACLQGWDLTKLDKHASTCLVVLLVSAFAMVLMDHDPGLVFRFMAIFLVWPALGLIARSRAGALLRPFAASSFPIFLAHGPLLAIAWIVYQRAPTPLPYAVFWIAAPIAIVLVTVAADRALSAVAPKARSLVVGGR